jgi:hypothetical protein
MTILSIINCDMGRFRIVQSNDTASCFFNGSELLKCGSSEMSTIVHIIGVLINSACNRQDSLINIIGDATNSDFINQIQDSINKSDTVKIHVLTQKPDETPDIAPVEARISFKNIDDYCVSFRNGAECIDDIAELIKMLSKTKLPKAVLAIQELNDKFEEMKNLDFLKDGEFVALSEQTEKDAHTLKIMKFQKIAHDDKHTLLLKTAKRLLKNYKRVKSQLSELISTCYPIYNINSSFKKYTGYPATWYYDPTLFYNFVEKYKDAADNLIDLTKHEKTVVMPLSSWNK